MNIAQTVITALLLKPANAPFGIDEPGNCQRAENEQRDQVHADDFADEQDQRNAENHQDYENVARHMAGWQVVRCPR